MKLLVSIILGLVLVGFVLSVMLSDDRKHEDNEQARKQLNEWQDRDILEE